MQERTFDLTTASGAMEVFIAHPSGDGPFPPVILYMDMWGIREELRDLTRRVATSGYYCVLPDLYYRWGKIRNSFKNEQGQRIGKSIRPKLRCTARFGHSRAPRSRFDGAQCSLCCPTSRYW